MQIGKLPGSIVCGWPKGQQQMGCAVEGNDGHPMLDVADQCVEDRIQVLIVREVTSSGAACFDADGQCQRLRVGVRIEGQMLRYPVVCEVEVIGCEFKDGSRNRTRSGLALD